MSGDHNWNQTDSGWRKRRIALDKKAENARELGLDYETNRTVMDMAREAGFEGCAELTWEGVICTEELERFAELVRADEREACAKVCEDAPEPDGADLAERIRARGSHD
jgi:hypothetical protein